MADRKRVWAVIDALLFLAVILMLALSGTRACGEELPEPLLAIGAGWTGEVSASPLSLANAEAEYILYSSPRYPMLYEVSHYRVVPKRRTGWFRGPGHGYPGHEAVYWFQPVPGVRRLVTRIFVNRSHRIWWSLWILPRYRWEELHIGSEAWIQEQGAALRLWSVHTLVYAYGTDATSLEF